MLTTVRYALTTVRYALTAYLIKRKGSFQEKIFEHFQTEGMPNRELKLQLKEGRGVFVQLVKTAIELQHSERDEMKLHHGYVFNLGWKPLHGLLVTSKQLDLFIAACRKWGEELVLHVDGTGKILSETKLKLHIYLI